MLPLPATAERPRRARAGRPWHGSRSRPGRDRAAPGRARSGCRRRAASRSPPCAADDARSPTAAPAGKPGARSARQRLATGRQGGARRRSDFPHRDASLDGGHLVIDGEERVRCGNAGPKAAGRRGYASPHDCGCRMAVAAGIPDRTSSESALLVAAGQRSPSRLRRALLQRTAVRSSGPNSPGAGEPVPGARSSSEPAHHKRWTLMLPRSASRSYRCRSRRSSRASRPRSAA